MKTKSKTKSKQITGVDFTPNTRWVVVAGSAQTQIYKFTPKALQLVESLKNPEARRLTRDMVSDKPGRTFSSAGGGRRHSLDPADKAHEFQMKKSAKAVAASLKAAFSEGRFHHLFLVAEPHFLGALRSALGKRLLATVEGEISKELKAKTDAELKRRTFEEVCRVTGRIAPSPTAAPSAEDNAKSLAKASSPSVNYPLEVTFRDIPPSEAIRNLILERAAKMSRFSRHILSGHVLISTPHRKKHHGTVYHVSIHLHLANKEIVINRDPEKDHAHEDAHVSIRDAFLAATRQLESFVRARRPQG